MGEDGIGEEEILAPTIPQTHELAYQRRPKSDYHRP